MQREFKALYAERGRKLVGFLLERAGVDSELDLAQVAPLGAPLADPPKNDGLIEG
jgi:hypothetical protein